MVKHWGLLGVVVVLAACSTNNSSSSGSSHPSGNTEPPSLTNTAVALTTSSAATVTEPSGSSQSAKTPSTQVASCVTVDPSNVDPPIPKLTDSKTSDHANYKFAVDYPSSWFDGTDMATVTAGGVVDPTTLHEAGLKSTDTLHNMNVAATTNFPLLTVYRLANVNDTADAVARRMATFVQQSGVQVSPTQSWCIDGTPAVGFLALAPSGSLQESWFAIHGGALYYAFFIGKTDGTQGTQDDLVRGFASILTTWRWT